MVNIIMMNDLACNVIRQAKSRVMGLDYYILMLLVIIVTNLKSHLFMFKILFQSFLFVIRKRLLENKASK